MTVVGSIGILAVIAIVLVLGISLGGYIHRVFTGARSLFEPAFDPVERLLYKLVGVNSSVQMDWKAYLRALMLVNFMMMIFAYFIFRLQGVLPLNLTHAPGMSWDLAFNTATSFITNTDWQNYSGEQSMSYLGQMLAITYLQFTSAATGIVAAIAFVRGLIGHRSDTLGNFWVDFIKVHTRILLPFAVIFSLVLIGMGVPQTLLGAQIAHTLQGATQTISRGPVASLESIKQLGTDGGGFFNANSAHPFEDPTALTSVLEMIAMGVIPVAMISTFGKFIANRRQATVLYVLLTGILVIGAFIVYANEAVGNPLVHQALGLTGPNMEGKEWRFGPALSSVFVAMTTAFTTGAVSSMHDSLMPISGLVPLLFMMFNLVFGGDGVGLLNILMFLMITVFLSGLMVGRTPEIFGKKIEAREIKLATAAMLVHPFIILVPTAIAVITKVGTSSMLNPGLHGFTEVLYAFTSAAANNGSAFAGLNGNTVFYNVVLGVVMLLGRYVSIIAMFAIAGSLVKKSVIPESVGTLRTDTFAFGSVFVAVFVIVGALTFFPALAIGPIGEQFQMLSHLTRH
ncbi:potassium-transporting ATPase subunit KdpA [Sulfoacidibacillus ferrooxidans]|uniref:Potassium-transporting ATPase potassium-binding subunit n=1 Tax=Sulfoacidibacillus ferrooxidans TaxID=2005001 RepID=A0A9X2ACT1_9BACL|nr:potassium-transporting ATPase subunit KdpA [Sulfoacidibacillus ferrooxidans]MCI0182665.1 Potassium-transporting ATPase potassium-binding subunit [Sulfoacidibacillus ferrooxidans]